MSRAMGMSPTRMLVCLDRSGAAVSGLCALHCALMPVLIALLPAVGLGMLADERTEWTLLILSVGLGLASLGLGYRVHRSPWVLVVVIVGGLLLGLGKFSEEGDLAGIGTALVVAGGLVVASAHLLSRRLCRLDHGERSR